MITIILIDFACIAVIITFLFRLVSVICRFVRWILNRRNIFNDKSNCDIDYQAQCDVAIEKYLSSKRDNK